MASAPTTILFLFKALGTGAVAASFGALKLAATGVGKALSAAGAGIAAGAKGLGLVAGGALAAARAVGSLGIAGVKGLAGLATSSFAAVKAIGAIGLKAAAVGAVLATALVVKTIDTANINTGVQNTLTAVYGDAARAKKEFSELGPEIDKMGLSISKIAPLYASFQAGASGTALAGEGARKVFFQVATAAKTMGLSIDEQQRVFTALSQVIGKGTLASEELKGQIGEALPGAFNIAARAVGVTAKELGNMLQAGSVLADDFLPKFGNQLEKEFGNIEGTTAKPAAAFERLKNVIFDAFTAIGNAGVNDLTVRAIDRLRGGLRALVEDGDVEFWAKGAVRQLSRLGAGLTSAGRTALNVLANIRLLTRGGLIPSAVTDTAALAYGFKTAGRLQAALNDKTSLGIAQRILEARNYASAIGRALVPAFRNAARAADGFIDFIGQRLPGVLNFLTNDAIPAATSGLQRLYGFFGDAGRYVLRFTTAIRAGSYALGYQVREMLNSLGYLKASLSDGLGISPEDLAEGTLLAIFKIGEGFYKLSTIVDSVRTNVGGFMDGLEGRGTFKKIREDISAVVQEIAGLVIPPQALSSPDALAAAFDAAYRKISEKTAATYGYLKDAGSAFLKGVTYEPGKDFPQQGQADNPEFEAYAQIGQAVRSIGDLFVKLGTEIIPKVVENVSKIAGPIAEAAANVFSLIDGFAQLVGSDAFTKILTLVLGLRLLGALGLGGIAAGVGAGLTGAVAAGITAALPAVLAAAGLTAAGYVVGKGFTDSMRPDAQARVKPELEKAKRMALDDGNIEGALKTTFTAIAREDSGWKTRMFNIFSPDGFFERTLKYAFRTPDERKAAYDRNENFLSASDYYFKYGNTKAIDGAFQNGTAAAELSARNIAEEAAAKARAAAEEAAKRGVPSKASLNGVENGGAAPGYTNVFQIGTLPPSPPLTGDQAAVDAWARQAQRELAGNTGYTKVF